jgi:hypothetical protein
MRLLTLTIMLFISLHSLAELTISKGIDPDLVDSKMTQVMYMISPKDIKITSYTGGFPSSLDLKLCNACMIKSYSLKSNAELLLNEQPLAIKDLAINLIKKKFDVIQLGIDRSTKAITYLYLGGISELDVKARAQEQSDEY